MNARLMWESVSLPRLLVWIAQVCGLVLFVGWVGLVIQELYKTRFVVPDMDAFYQAGALAVVFGGYLLSRTRALAGSALALAGIVGFFAIAFATSGVLPELNAAWFAVPAVLTLAAWAYNRRRRHQCHPGWRSV